MSHKYQHWDFLSREEQHHKAADKCCSIDTSCLTSYFPNLLDPYFYSFIYNMFFQSTITIPFSNYVVQAHIPSINCHHPRMVNESLQQDYSTAPWCLITNVCIPIMPCISLAIAFILYFNFFIWISLDSSVKAETLSYTWICSIQCLAYTEYLIFLMNRWRNTYQISEFIKKALS